MGFQFYSNGGSPLRKIIFLLYDICYVSNGGEWDYVSSKLIPSILGEGNRYDLIELNASETITRGGEGVGGTSL